MVQRKAMAAAAALIAAVLTLGLSGCVPEPETPTAAPTQTSRPTPSKTPTPTPTKAPQLVPGGTAGQNLAFFNYVNQATFNSVGFVEGRPYIDNLTANGFNRADMFLTWWDTPDGHLADSIFFGVMIGSECLVGQIAGWGYTGEVLPVLSTGSCVIGDYLQPIDW